MNDATHFPSTGILASVFAARIATLSTGEIARTFGTGFLVRSCDALRKGPSTVETDPLGDRAEHRRDEDVVVFPLKRADQRASSERLSVGRIASNDVWICERNVSRVHAWLFPTAHESYSIEDANSRNGTRVQGMKLKAGERLLLASGDVLELGGIAVLFIDHTMIAKLVEAVSSASLEAG